MAAKRKAYNDEVVEKVCAQSMSKLRRYTYESAHTKSAFLSLLAVQKQYLVGFLFETKGKEGDTSPLRNRVLATASRLLSQNDQQTWIKIMNEHLFKGGPWAVLR